MFPPLFPRSPTVNPTAARIEREFKHPSPLIGCRFDPSGRFLFATAQDNTILRYDLLTGAKTVLAGHQSWSRGLTFVPSPATGAEEATPAASPAALQAVAGFGVATLPVPKPRPFTLVSA